ncbi:30S ribosomal protein S16 [Candidatus Marinamargulisbacteria bacterium SCGC AG-343-K17]|nr:30S ribosomal protein S16 [Candidatus Marinamargulisbacteria bacterium SCGC AG-343-K17]
MRKGRKKKPLYRIVVIEDSNQRDGKTIEDIGTYNPHTEPASITVKEDRAKHWISVGAQPSNTVNRLLSTVGLTEHTPLQSSSQKVAKKDRQSSKKEEA